MHINQLLKLLIGASFTVGLAIGFFTKRFIFLIVSLIAGAGMAILTLVLYPSSNPKDVGLGIIALLPALVILLGASNIGAAFVGGIIGTMIGKRRRKT
ncbi:MAG: hypothetical protein HYV25_01555 [Candidatus Harrisonbacteria bacterium]|nr:hypothetical protein [Candidatus Harrisonbacteria bacterium]